MLLGCRQCQVSWRTRCLICRFNPFTEWSWICNFCSQRKPLLEGKSNEMLKIELTATVFLQCLLHQRASLRWWILKSLRSDVHGDWNACLVLSRLVSCTYWHCDDWSLALVVKRCLLYFVSLFVDEDGLRRAFISFNKRTLE